MTLGSLLPIFTLLLGYATSSLSEWLRDRRAREREREAREATRSDQLYERRTNFQRQTLLDLQDALMDLVRTAGAMHHKDVTAYRGTGRWQKQFYDEQLDESARFAQARTSMLNVRVRDEAIRELVKEVKDHINSAGAAANREDSERSLASMASTFEKLNQRLGQILRELDDNL